MLVVYKLKHENGIKKQQKYAPTILSSFDLSFTIHSSQSQSHGTIPLRSVLLFVKSIPSEVKRSEKNVQIVLLRNETKRKNVNFVSLRSETKNFWKQSENTVYLFRFGWKRKIRSEKKRNEAKKNNFFSRERAKRMRNGSRFASFRFEAKKFLKRNRRTLLLSNPTLPAR
jgi:hypothetical protein